MQPSSEPLPAAPQILEKTPSSRRALLTWVAPRSSTPLLAAIACSVLLLVGLYRIPLQRVLDIGPQTGSIPGTYPPERNERFSFAYAKSDAVIALPGAGTGRFVATLRLGGPNGDIPVSAHLDTPAVAVDLGTLDHVRVHQVLIPTDTGGTFEVHLRSSRIQVSGDSRRFGALLDWIRVRSVGVVTPPASLLFGTPVILLLLWGIVSQLRIEYRPRVGLFLLCAAAVCAGYASVRGRIAPEPGWIIGAGIFVLVAIGLGRFEGRFATPFRAVATLFFAWRAALWLICGVALWYSSAVYNFGRSLTSGGAVAPRDQFLRQILVDSWIHWDSPYYLDIALNGYSFYERDWPNIAFFPLYPLLIRLLLPLAIGNTSIAALLVSHLALFGALLLLYDLVARDFGSGVAYRSLLFLLLFPTSVYLVAGYTEALALVLAVAVLWALRRQRWWLAGIAGCLLTLTRLPGVMAAPLIAYAYLQHHGWRWRSIRPAILAVLLPPLGLALFMLFQWWRFDTPVAFMIAQERWDQRLSPPWVMPKLWLDFYHDSSHRPIMLFQAIIWLSFIGLMLGALVRMPRLYGLAILLLLAPPYLSNRGHSLPRYVLLGFPAFVLLALVASRPRVRGLVIGTMLFSLVITILLFVNGFWIA